MNYYYYRLDMRYSKFILYKSDKKNLWRIKRISEREKRGEKKLLDCVRRYLWWKRINALQPHDENSSLTSVMAW